MVLNRSAPGSYERGLVTLGKKLYLQEKKVNATGTRYLDWTSPVSSPNEMTVCGGRGYNPREY